MAKLVIKLNNAGIGQILRSPKVTAAVRDAAERVADGVKAQALAVETGGEDHPETTLTAEVEMDTTDRAMAHVRIPHPAATAMQARHGVLTKAAADAGLEVRS